MKYAYIDFEFNRVTHPRVNLVCCALGVDGVTEKYWLHNDSSSMLELKIRLKILGEQGYTFISYSVEAEARSFHSLGLDPTKFKWLDLFLEWRMLLNHNIHLEYGMHLNEDGEPHKVSFGKGSPHYGYAGAVFRLLNERVDTAHKTKMRDLIISDPDTFTDEQKEAILNYCSSDIKYLPRLQARMYEETQKMLGKKGMKDYVSHTQLRGEYAARTGVMVDLGYPIHVEWVRNFSRSVEDILTEIIEDILEQFPDLQPWRKEKNKGYVMSQSVLRSWIVAQKLPEWELTDGGKSGVRQLSLSLEAWTKYFNYSHEFPRNNFGSQMVRYLKAKQSLYGFVEARTPSSTKKKKKKFWDAVGPDGRVRPYFGIYGAQSGRSQPSSTGFIPLKSAWMRSMISPPTGYALASIDWSSEEFLLSALISKDPKMLAAYETGDVYLAFAKEIGLVPKDGKREDYQFERDVCKSTVLGLSYLMTNIGLAIKLTADTGKLHTEDQAEQLVQAFAAAYDIFAEYREEIVDNYRNVDNHLILPCGWAMGPDNRNHRSIANMPIQGMGSSIMRKAVALAQDAGLDVVYTLHDALTIQYRLHDYAAIDKLAECMDEAFRYYFPKHLQKRATCRLDANTWSLEYLDGKITTPKGMPVAVQSVYVDKRGKKEYEKFSKYFHQVNPVDWL